MNDALKKKDPLDPEWLDGMPDNNNMNKPTVKVEPMKPDTSLDARDTSILEKVQQLGISGYELAFADSLTLLGIAATAGVDAAQLVDVVTRAALVHYNTDQAVATLITQDVKNAEPTDSNALLKDMDRYFKVADDAGVEDGGKDDQDDDVRNQQLETIIKETDALLGPSLPLGWKMDLTLPKGPMDRICFIDHAAKTAIWRNVDDREEPSDESVKQTTLPPTETPDVTKTIETDPKQAMVEMEARETMVTKTDPKQAMVEMEARETMVESEPGDQGAKDTSCEVQRDVESQIPKLDAHDALILEVVEQKMGVTGFDLAFADSAELVAFAKAANVDAAKLAQAAARAAAIYYNMFDPSLNDKIVANMIAAQEGELQDTERYMEKAWDDFDESGSSLLGQPGEAGLPEESFAKREGRGDMRTESKLGTAVMPATTPPLDDGNDKEGHDKEEIFYRIMDREGTIIETIDSVAAKKSD